MEWVFIGIIIIIVISINYLLYTLSIYKKYNETLEKIKKIEKELYLLLERRYKIIENMADILKQTSFYEGSVVEHILKINKGNKNKNKEHRIILENTISLYISYIEKIENLNYSYLIDELMVTEKKFNKIKLNYNLVVEKYQSFNKYLLFKFFPNLFEKINLWNLKAFSEEELKKMDK